VIIERAKYISCNLVVYNIEIESLVQNDIFTIIVIMSARMGK
jgi:hypothetical protein